MKKALLHKISSNKINQFIFRDSFALIHKNNIFLREWLESKLEIIYMKAFTMIKLTVKDTVDKSRSLEIKEKNLLSIPAN
jgi:hypothetical protein